MCIIGSFELYILFGHSEGFPGDVSDFVDFSGTVLVAFLHSLEEVGLLELEVLEFYQGLKVLFIVLDFC